MEKVANARIIQVENVCDGCGIGLMRPTGEMFDCRPPVFIHRCENCGRTAGFNVKYPLFKTITTEPLRAALAEEV